MDAVAAACMGRILGSSSGPASARVVPHDVAKPGLL
jgi:hypothetical protein